MSPEKRDASTPWRILAVLVLVLTLGACSQSLDFHDEATRCIERTHHRFLGVEYRDKEIVWDKWPCKDMEDRPWP